MTVSQDDPLRDLLPLTAVDLMVLVVLLGADSYGYRMVREMRERSDGRIDLLPGNLYAVLQRLERDELVEKAGRRPAGDEGGPPRSYFRITDLGREAVALEATRLRRLVDTPDVRQLLRERAR